MVWKCGMGCICCVYRSLTGLLHHSRGKTDQFYLYGYSFWPANIHQGVLDMNPVTSSLLPVTQHFPEGSFYASKFSPLQSETTLGLLCSLLTQMLTWPFSFICNSAWVMTMKSCNGWQSFEPVVQNSQKVNCIVIKLALQEKRLIVLFVFRFRRSLTS